MTIGPGHFISLHSLLVLMLAPPLGWLLTYLASRNAEPSTPAKLVWGLVASCAAFVSMGSAGLQGGETGRVGAGWLVGCYVPLTIGDVLMAMMSLALITRIAPPSRTSQMVGLWFAATAVGSWLAGGVGLLWHRWPHHRYFLLLAALTLCAAALLLARLTRIERLLAADRAIPRP